MKLQGAECTCAAVNDTATPWRLVPTPKRQDIATRSGEGHCGDLPLSLQLTFEVSPFLGHFCFCDCCSFAAREVSFCPEAGLLVDVVGLADELVDGGVDVEEFAGVF